MERKRLLRITTVPLSLVTLLKGQPAFFSEHGFEVLTVSAKGKEAEQLRTSGIAHRTVWLTRQITPIRDVIAIVQLVRIIRSFKPHIVHTHTPKAGLIGMIAAWLCRVPIRLHTIAGLPWIQETGFKRWILMQVEAFTYRCAHQVYPNSNVLCQFLMQELKFQTHKTKVIGRGSSNGIDVEFFKRDDVLVSYGAELRKRHKIAQEAIVFSFVGRVVKDKGIVELVEAFEELNKSMDAWLLLVGDLEPELDPLPESTLQSLKNNSQIIMAGFQQDVRPWLLASDVFVFPSHREGFPNGVMQACCLELPVIATDINGCNEIIENNVSGILIPVNDKEALKGAMLRLARDTTNKKEYGLKGRNFVVQNFSQLNVWSALLDEYKNLLPYRIATEP